MGLKAEILSLNEERNRAFDTTGAYYDRIRHAGKHPTQILVFKCMDGRINLPLITGVPMGILKPFRNIGGIFTMGDPYLGRLVLDAVERVAREGHSSLALCTFHFSKEHNDHRGCAGHKYNIAASREGAFTLKHEFDEIFGMHNSAISAIVVGVETDEDALILCGNNGEELSIADCINFSDAELTHRLRTLYPEVPEEILRDLLPLVLNNREHVARIKKEGRPVLELVHNENIIGVGRGFDWLHLPNRALIIGPYGHTGGTWREAVEVAGRIVLNNFKSNPALKAGGALLLISAPYVDTAERGVAIAKAKYFAIVAKQALEPFADELSLDTLVGITDITKMKYHPLTQVSHYETAS
ncbi:hypothetical protein IPH92_04315 [Candidatus Kaiserbacteria bacterium]|nr:MAG: hypothetical protein IPH92_04315 [Candidatus Kaiserbacteria bacterium]